MRDFTADRKWEARTSRSCFVFSVFNFISLFSHSCLCFTFHFFFFFPMLFIVRAKFPNCRTQFRRSPTRCTCPCLSTHLCCKDLLPAKSMLGRSLINSLTARIKLSVNTCSEVSDKKNTPRPPVFSSGRFSPLVLFNFGVSFPSLQGQIPRRMAGRDPSRGLASGRTVFSLRLKRGQTGKRRQGFSVNGRQESL